MATITTLNLGDSGPSPHDDLQRERQILEYWSTKVQAMLDSGDYDFAWGYLNDLSATLAASWCHRITPAQIQAVENILEGKDRHDEQLARWDREREQRGRSRRYEGWDDRWR